MKTEEQEDTQTVQEPVQDRKPAHDRKRNVPNLGIQVIQCVVLSVLALGSYFLVSHYVIQSVEVVGPSMAPTLHHSDRYVLNRLAYVVHGPKPKDIVVVKDPTDGTFVIKRIIAMPGDAVLFKNGEVYVNGQRLSEPYVHPGNRTYTYSDAAEQLIVCGRDQYFLLGDNRENSFDSRMYGPVRRQNILGVVNL
jgi:signal peptidase I, bacterial type